MPALPASPVRSRRWRLDRRSLLLALLLFGLLVLLATLGRHWGWIRSFGGDLLAVVWLYYLMGSALRAPAAWLASAAFAVGDSGAQARRISAARSTRSDGRRRSSCSTRLTA